MPKLTKRQIQNLPYEEVVALVEADARDVRATLDRSTGRGVKAKEPTFGEIVEARPASEFEPLRDVFDAIFDRRDTATANGPLSIVTRKETS